MQGKHWDAVVIGTGFGGSMTAYKLVNAGLSVLMLERGDWVVRDESSWDSRAILIDQKYKSATPYETNHWIGKKLVYPNDVVGGSSVFYGAASLRLRVEDFDAGLKFGADIPHALQGATWPICYDDLAPYYDEAEKLLDVHGVAGVDPNEPPRATGYASEPPAFSRPARLIAQAGETLGLHPFPIPLAINFGDSSDRTTCIQCMTCDLFPCKIAAKNDLAVTVLPSCESRGATIKTNTVAASLAINKGKVTGVHCLDTQTYEQFLVECDLCVVSCGAIASPALLLASGLGESGLNGKHIGRHLMRHCSGIAIGLFPATTNPEQVFHKQVAFTDFYLGHPDGLDPPGPWGMMQGLQVPPPEYMTGAAPFPVGQLGAATCKFHIYLLCIAEDLPNPNNRVTLSNSKTDQYGQPIKQVTHKYDQRDLAARRGLYRQAMRVLKAAGAKMRVRKPINTFSHAQGTCRFGNDPNLAVLDQNCQFFGVPNLYVVDASFMPTSAGVNPSLTIAANALRVGEHLVENWEALKRGIGS
ncbi:MAG: GMC family oxidoreductase [Gemmatimonadetes bacterium]|nr:GMC family oxidoreductase [Gemmatimonadota bacterium]